MGSGTLAPSQQEETGADSIDELAHDEDGNVVHVDETDGPSITGYDPDGTSSSSTGGGSTDTQEDDVGFEADVSIPTTVQAGESLPIDVEFTCDTDCSGHAHLDVRDSTGDLIERLDIFSTRPSDGSPVSESFTYTVEDDREGQLEVEVWESDNLFSRSSSYTEVVPASVPDFVVRGINAPGQLASGDPFEATVEVLNDGDGAGDVDVELVGGDFEGEQTVSLEPGEAEDVAFNLPAPEDVGDVEYVVDAGDDSDSFTVEVVEDLDPAEFEIVGVDLPSAVDGYELL